VKDKTITLPGAQEIMDRLRKLDMGANDYMAEKFYPLIAAEAEHELLAQGVVMMLAIKIHEFVDSGYPAFMETILHMYVPQIIDVLVDDQEVAEEAKRFHQAAIDATS